MYRRTGGSRRQNLEVAHVGLDTRVQLFLVGMLQRRASE
jgi:hypothetical protein